jgi:hypothetical protein
MNPKTIDANKNIKTNISTAFVITSLNFDLRNLGTLIKIITNDDKKILLIELSLEVILVFKMTPKIDATNSSSAIDVNKW